MSFPSKVRRAPSWLLGRLEWAGRQVVKDTEDWEATFYAQLQVLYSFVFFLFACFWGVAELLMGHHRVALVFGAFLAALGGIFAWAWKSRRMSFFAHVIMFLAVLLFSVTTYMTGGLRTTNVAVFFFSMVAGPCTLGRSGLLYSAASVIIALAFQAAAWCGHVFPDFSDPSNIERDSFLTWFSSAIGLMIVLLSWEWIRSSTAKRMKAHEEALSQSTRQLHEAQKMETVGRLAGGIAHDFNNLLTTIIGCADLARREIEEGHVCRTDIENVIEAGNRATKLTQQLLAFSRRQVLKPAPVNLNDVVSNLSHLLERVFSEAVTIETSLDPDLRDAMLDPGQTEQLFLNLAINAHESMPEGGLLRIETDTVVRSPPAPSNPERETASAPMVVLRIADTGCGMSEDDKARIFEPFYTTKTSGTGLGLAVVYGIVKQQNGWIELDSIEGEGSTFTVFLPALTSQSGSSRPAAWDNSMTLGGGERVLVIEDEELVRRFAEKLLDRAGYDVCVAESGEAAMRIIEAEGDGLRLIFSDVVLPGLSGLEVAKHVRKQLPSVPVLLTSGYSEKLADDGPELSDVPFIHKPYEAEVLLKMIKGLLAT